jgi:hypothetical protein
MKRTIKKVAVIGSELWVQELLAILPTLVSFLLDIVPRELTEAETKKIDIREQSSTQSFK